jgi:hypothetical protein
MILTAPFTPRVITISQCQIRYSIVDLDQESRYFIGHFLKVMTRGVEGAVGIIFDIILSVMVTFSIYSFSTIIK